MAEQPLVAPLAISGGVAQPQNPLALLNEVTQLQGRLLDNKNKMNSQAAQETLSAIFATTDPEKLPEAIMRSPASAYHPEIMTHAAGAAKALVDMAHTRQGMSNTATEQYRKDMIAAYNDPYLTAESLEAIRMVGAANITDPIARQIYLDKSQLYLTSITAGAPSRAELMSDPELQKKWSTITKQRLLAQSGAAWGWEASRDIALGGPVEYREPGVHWQRRYDTGGRPVRLRPVPEQPGGSSAAPALAPAAPAPAPAAPGLGAGEGSSTPPGGIPSTMDAAGAGGDPGDGGEPNALAPGGGYGPSGGPASLEMPMPPDAAPGAPGYAPGDVQMARLGPLPGTAGPDGPLPPGPPAEAQMAQAAPGGRGAAGAAAPAPDLGGPTYQRQGQAPRINSHTGEPAWGNGATAYSYVGGVPVAKSDGFLMWNPKTGIGKAPKPHDVTDFGLPVYEKPVQDMIDKMSAAFTEDKVKKYPNAQMILSQVAQMDDAFDQLRAKGGRFLQPGATLPERMQMYRIAKDLINIVGGTVPKELENAEASFGNLEKLMTQMGFTNINQFFGAAREAATVIQSSMAAVPGINNTYVAAKLRIRLIEMMAQRTVDEEIFKQKWFNENRGDLRDWDTAFNKQHDVGQMTQSVLSEFGMGRYGYKNKDGSWNHEGIRNAHLRGLLDEQQIEDLYAGREMRPNAGMQ